MKNLAPRARNTHKGDYGHVLIIGGELGMLGAARMAGEAAARVGSGLVSIATRKHHAALISVVRPELMSHGIESARALKPLLGRATVCVIGPGLGQCAWAKKLLGAVLTTDLPLVLDADALNLLSQKKVGPCKNWILTPHPGEAARLLNTTVSEVQSDRSKAAKQIQNEYGGICILKGAGTLVCDTTGKLNVIDYGNPGMASGGMGDVLSGVLGGLLAQGLTLDVAAIVGATIHSCAADRAARDGERGLLAMDLMPHLRHLANPSS